MLVLCGSHVPLSDPRSSRSCSSGGPRAPSGSGPEPLANGTGAEEIAAAVAATRARLDDGGLAVVATHRDVFEGGDRLRSGASIASGLAAILAGARDRAGIVVSKGGITSAINVREGLDSGVAEVRGPLLDGVSLWSVDTPERAALPFVVFPGNVGGDDELADLVEAIAAAGS